MWKKVRIGLLLYLLAMVAAGTWLSRTRSTDWTDTLWVTIHPINGDGSDTAARYIESLQRADFESIADFFADEAEFYDVGLSEPVRIELAGELHEQPPAPPDSANPLRVALWSLRLRFWVFTVDKQVSTPADIEVFVRYFDPETNPRLAHSLGLQKGLIGVVNAFAHNDHRGSNNVVIAHELLHTLGATDKYDPRSNEPLYPDGFADPQAEPLFPQVQAEVMAGRIPITDSESRMASSLKSVVIGELTALEIGLWEN